MIKKALWGTGLIASKYVGYYGCTDIDFFLDNNSEKKGTYFYGKPVLHPSEVLDWKNLFVFVPYNYYEDISVQLRQKGLKEGTDFTSYGIVNKKINTELTSIEYDKFFGEIKRSIDDIQNKSIVFGIMAAHDKGICNFLNQWNKSLGGEEFVLFSEASWIPDEQVKAKIDFKIINLPSFFDFKTYPVQDGIEKHYEAEKKEIIENPFLLAMAKQYRNQYQSMKKDYEYYFIYTINHFFEKLFFLIKPKTVVLWCSYGILHIFLRYLSQKMRILVGCIHPGIFAGTFSLDVDGEIGESYPALYAKAFKMLPVAEEIPEAKKIIDYLHKSAINRKIQPQNDVISKLNREIIPNRPVIFFAGQNDYESGLQMPDELRNRYYSPIFKTSADTAVFLSQICIKNNWNFIYKPHPMMDFYENQTQIFSEGIIFIDKADINQLVDFSDVTVTILSQTSYVALIREKPVVMLGKTQLLEKGCTYEAFKKEDVEVAIRDALISGFSLKQKENFCIHSAQLLKYYLFDDLQVKPFSYGRKLPVTWEELEAFAEKLKRVELKNEIEIQNMYEQLEDCYVESI